MTRAIGLIAAFLVSSSTGVAQTTDETRAFLTYLGGQGCVIGPGSTAQAQADGFAPDFVAAQIDTLTPLGQPLAGDYVLLDAPLCTITLPKVTQAPSLSDADVLRTFVAYDDGTGTPGPGCVLDRATFDDWMPLAKGWTADETALAYSRMVAAGLVSGDLRFFSEDILETPPGVQLVTGRCESAPDAAKKRATHDEIVQWFDPFLRAVATQTPCRNGVTLLDADGFAVLADLTGGTHVNAWLAFEIWLIAYGGGWYSFVDANDRGTPRPPACGALE